MIKVNLKSSLGKMETTRIYIQHPQISRTQARKSEAESRNMGWNSAEERDRCLDLHHTFIKRLTLSIFFEKNKRLYLRRGKFKSKTIILLRESKGNNIARKQGWYEKENIHIRKPSPKMLTQIKIYDSRNEKLNRKSGNLVEASFSN